MKRKQFFECKAALESVKNYTGMEFRVIYFKNMQLLTEKVKEVEEKISASAEWAAFEKAATELKVKHAKKVPGTDQPVIENNNFIMECIEKFMEEFHELRKSFKDVISEREEQLKNYNAYLEEEIEISFVRIKNTDLPADMKAGEYAALAWMIEE
jgi:hypothetical protein